jgi:hypothetical protein
VRLPMFSAGVSTVSLPYFSPVKSSFFVECRIEYFALSPVAATECVFCCRYHITSIGFICLNQFIQTVLQFHHSFQKSKAFVAHIECGFMTYSDFLGSFIQWSE